MQSVVGGGEGKRGRERENDVMVEAGCLRSEIGIKAAGM